MYHRKRQTSTNEYGAHELLDFIPEEGQNVTLIREEEWDPDECDMPTGGGGALHANGHHVDNSKNSGNDLFNMDDCMFWCCCCCCCCSSKLRTYVVNCFVMYVFSASSTKTTEKWWC